MKKTGLLLLLALFCLNLSAQDRTQDRKEDRREKLEAARIAFITTELSLTPEEAQKFWPLFNQREAEMRALRHQLKTCIKDKAESLSDTEAEKSIEAYFSLRQQELDLEKKYDILFREVLPARKVSQLYSAERRFKGEVLRQWKENRNADKP